MSPRISILLVISVVVVSGNQTPGVIFIARFLKDLSKRLDVPIIDSHLVKSEGQCSARCVKNRECVSYNLKKKQTTSCDENVLCELLHTDKFNETTALKSSTDFDYFYPPSECVKNPCKNGGSCRTIYNTNSYHCICTPRWTGANCETLMDYPECASYTTLSDASRNVNSPKTTRICDSGLVKKWYRFEGAAGTVIPSACPSENLCNTHATGWVNGAHPTVEEGIVTRKVCYHWSSSCCNWSNDIRILNCGSYYIYELIKPPGCSLRYCGE
ncbi:uromodulin [Nematostella vectensis]|uniref:uromodulin n=1 Tax=Nematostella vectensis TaxID=45351 RepID=UPI002076EEA3|nr:uromodulin [Nematostella vectensis]